MGTPTGIRYDYRAIPLTKEEAIEIRKQEVRGLRQQIEDLETQIRLVKRQPLQTERFGMVEIAPGEASKAGLVFEEVEIPCGFTFKLPVNTFEIWSEGYLCTGMEGLPSKARLLATIEADSFHDACVKFFTPEVSAKHGGFDPERMSVWGCRLFDNEEDAREFERRYES